MLKVMTLDTLGGRTIAKLYLLSGDVDLDVIQLVHHEATVNAAVKIMTHIVVFSNMSPLLRSVLDLLCKLFRDDPTGSAMPLINWNYQLFDGETYQGSRSPALEVEHNGRSFLSHQQRRATNYSVYAWNGRSFDPPEVDRYPISSQGLLWDKVLSKLLEEVS